MDRIHKILFLMLTCFLASSCSDSSFEQKPDVREVRIAVVLPEESRPRWDRIMNLIRKNISEVTDICPVFEFYDENSHDMMTLAYDLAHDDSIVSVIGCVGEASTEILAYQMSRLKKPKPMFTFNTSQNVIRKYARKGFMWGLCESDITQSEVLLAQVAQSMLLQDVSLIAGNTPYGQTFVDWFAFQARELGLNPVRIVQYEDSSEIESYMRELCDLGCALVCVPNSYYDAALMINYSEYVPSYFSHKTFNEKTFEYLREIDPEAYVWVKGVTLISDPSSGFQDIYEARYDQSPIFGEAQLYDAIMITCLAYAASEVFDISLNEAVAELLEPEGVHLGNWMKEGIEDAYEQIVIGKSMPRISGAIGELSFVPDKHTIIQYSTYAVQYATDGRFYQADFISRGEGGNTSSTYSAWEWEKFFDQDFDAEQEANQLNPYTGNKAVLVATSRGWDNYRHQADILGYYQVLKSRGFTDDEIILIMADDIAYNEANPYKGVVVRSEDGENLYKDVIVDYTLDQLTPADFKNILLGKASEELPVVLDSDAGDNVLFILSGHGIPGVLEWDENKRTLTGAYMADIFNEMYENGRYRRLFCMIETCYSGSVAMECVGIPNLLLMTAANDKETSKAEIYDPVRRTYLTNSFSSSVLAVIDDMSLSMRDLYKEAFTMTMGSHVTYYNVEYYGNIFESYLYDYFCKWYE